MEAFKYLRQLYSGERSISRHITLFSITGIMVLALNNVISNWGNNLMFSFITTARLSEKVVILNFILCCFLIMFLIGYEYVFIHNTICDNKVELPEFKAESGDIFFKMLPIFILWQFYFTIVLIVGVLVLNILKNQICTYTFWSIMLCLTPFIFMVYIRFAKDYKYRFEIFFPWTIFKYMNNTLMDVMLFFLQFCLIVALPVFALIGFSDWVSTIKSPTLKLALSLGNMCLCTYLFIVFKYIFSTGMAKIVKSKILKEND